MSNNIKRKALVIGSPAKGGRFLKGVNQDLVRVPKFLRVDRGGAWMNDEIKILSNPTREQTLEAVKRATADYSFIYFSGHGGAKITGERVLEVCDGYVSAHEFVNDSPKQLIVADACADYVGAMISGVEDYYGDVYESFTGENQARELFKWYIENSDDGKIMAHAAQLGQSTGDSDFGGYFTQAILHIATRMKTETDYYPVSIYDVLQYAPSLLEQKNIKDIPTPAIEWEGNLSVPFSFGFKKTIQKIRQLPQRPMQNSGISNGEAAALGVGLILLIAALGSK
jgi:hypothetical protein